jgi:hypothetical protein
MGFPVGVLPWVSSAQAPTGFALRILENGTVIAKIGGFVVVTRAKRAQSAKSRFCEFWLRGKKLDEVVAEADQGPLGTDLEDTSQ